MQNSCLLQRLFKLSRLVTTNKNYSKAINLEKLETEDVLEVEADEESKAKEEAINLKRDKSRLQPGHRNFLLGKVPYDEPKHWSHGTLKYQRKLLGRCGSQSRVDPSLCWPTREELALKWEYEGIAYPYSIAEMVTMAKTKRDEKAEKIEARQKQIVANISKLETWQKELVQKIEKKEAEAMAAKNRKEHLIEEVRRHFGYTVDPRDERFKEMLEKKEKEQTKAAKDARKKAKEDRVVSKLLSQSNAPKSQEN